jgi:hypothetical protein
MLEATAFHHPADKGLFLEQKRHQAHPMLIRHYPLLLIKTIIVTGIIAEITMGIITGIITEALVDLAISRITFKQSKLNVVKVWLSQAVAIK